MVEFLGAQALVGHRVVDREEKAIVRQVDRGADRFQDDAAPIFENLAVGIIRGDRRREDDKGLQRIALIIGPFGIIAVRRKEQIELAEESCLAALVEPEQRLVDEVAVAEQIARQADAGRGPGRVIVDAVDHLGRLVRQEARHRADHIVVDPLALVGGERLADLSIALHRVHEEDAVVEALPEEASRHLVRRRGMRPEPRIEVGISE